MKVVSFIEDPPVIRCILEHLDLRKDPRPQLRPLEGENPVFYCQQSDHLLPLLMNTVRAS